MTDLTDTDRKRIEAAIQSVEGRTRCEFVAVLAPTSGGYGFVRWGLPALVALVLPWLLRVVVPIEGTWLLTLQLVVFAALATAFQWSSLVHVLVPRSIQDDAAAQAARAQFHMLGLTETAGRTGVLLYVSEVEHYVEILADRDVAAKVPPEAWQVIVDRFVADIRQRRLADGFERAIAACGDVLARDFPPVIGDKNELPDRLVEL